MIHTRLTTLYTGYPSFPAQTPRQRQNARKQKFQIRAVDEEPEIKQQLEIKEQPKKRKADSSDPVASFLTRRFGVGAGLAWLGILAVGSLGEQIKTRLEVRQQQESAREVTLQEKQVLSSGVEYIDKKIGGGETPYDGALVSIDLKASVDGVVFEDTFQSPKQIVFLMGKKKLLSEGLTEGLLQALETMKTGGIREVSVPSSVGFGSKGTVLFPGQSNEVRIPPNAHISYLVELKRVSIAP